MKRTFLLICAMSLCTMLSWGQTKWDLSETMKATLDTDGVLTITTTAESEAMPDYTVSAYTLEYSPLWFTVRNDIRSVVIEDNITTIGDYAFFSCINLTSVTIPNSVLSIGERAFIECTALEAITLPAMATTIGERAFWGCSQLASVTLPDSLTSIGMAAFGGCSRITTLTIPKTVTSIGQGAFAFGGVNALVSVTIEWETPLSMPVDIFEGYLGRTTLYVPAGTKSLYRKVDPWRFFPKIVEEREDVLTWELSATMSASLDLSGVMTISTTAVSEAMPDFEVIAPVTFSTPWFDYTDEIISVVIEDNITTVGDFSFANCYYLTSVTIPGSITKIGEGAFAGSDIPSISIPGHVTTIGAGAFDGCFSLVEISIPPSVTSIGEYAFSSYSYYLGVSVTVAWDTPLTVPATTFISTLNSTLRVPTGTKALYEVAPVWKDFETIVEYDYTANANIGTPTALQAFASGGILHVSGLRAGKTFSIYSLTGQLVYNGIAKAETEQIPLNARDIYIVTSGEQTVKAIVF